MAIQKFYPPVSDLIDTSAIPGDFTALEDAAQQGVNALLGKIYYKDLAVQIDPSGESKTYSLTLLTKTLRVPLFSDFNIVFFKGNETTLSEFPILFRWNWPLNKYIRNFNLQGFSYAPNAFIDVLIELSEIRDRKDFFNQIVEAFLNNGDGAYTGFFNTIIPALNSYNNGNPSVNTEISSIQNNLATIQSYLDVLLSSSNFFTLKDIYENYESHSTLSTAVTQIEQSLNVLETQYNIQINLFTDVISSLIGNFSDLDEKLARLVDLFKRWLSDITIEDIKALLIPQFFFQLNGIAMALEFPRTVLLPMTETSPGIWEVESDETIKADVRFTSGPLVFDSRKGFEIDFDNSSLSLPRCRLANTQLDLEFLGIKLDLSRKKNIPEAVADGRPVDFIGVYITEGNIFLPASWNHDDGASTAQIKVRNFLVGTGGVSGTVGMEAKTAGQPAPLIKANFGDKFSVSLDAFDITFKQNTVTSSNIKGTLTIPGFKDASGNDAEINIKVWIGQDGAFSVTASEEQGITLIKIPDILNVNIKSLTLGRKNNKMYVAVSGTIDFADQSGNANGGFIANNLPKDIEIQKLLIWEDGSFEFEGGGIELRKPLTMKLGPVALSITAIHFGSHEQEHNGILRKYKFFGFDGGVSIKPGGVDARGDGIKFYFTVDNGPGKPLDFFVRIQSIAIDLMIPGTATPETAAVIMKGYLAMKSPEGGAGSSAGTEYSGGIELTLPKLKIAGSAAMRYNPSVPSFIIDIGLELPTALPLGSTGLGIYGFRGLFGLRYVASREYVGLPADAEWWQYYKKKVAPDNKEGIFINKMEQREGTSIGAGVSLCTVPDGGRTFSAKLFFMLSLPDVFLLQGQAAILSERIGLNDPNDPPFFALIAISSTSVEAALGVNYNMPASGSNLGKIVKVTGVLELAFFWGNSFNWYLNLGREMPEDRRIRARIFDLFDCYYFLMISSQGIYTGAGASYNFNKSYGPVKVKLQAYMDIRGKISFKPIQVGGSIQLGASLEIKVFGIGFGLSADAGLAAEAPKPFIISGFIRVSFKILWKTFSFKVEFSWTFSNQLDLSEVPVVDAVLANVAKAINAHTKEAFPLYIQKLSGVGSASPTLPAIGPANLENYTVPMDSFIDIEFKQGMHATGADPSLSKFNGITSGFEYTAMVPPQRGKSKQVKHEFFVDKVELKIWNPQTNSWNDYNPYKAMTPLADLPNLDISPYATFDQYVDGQNLKFGSWQTRTVNKYNVLRLMATNPLSYMTQGVPFIPEELQITSETLFCTEPPRQKICVEVAQLGRPRPGTKDELYVPANQSLMLNGVLFRLIGTDGQILSQAYGSVNSALRVLAGESLEIYPPEPVTSTSLLLQATSANVVIMYYKRVQTGFDASSMPVYGWQLIQVVSKTATQLVNPVDYQNTSVAIDKIVIKAGPCPKTNSCITFYERIVRLEEFLNTLISTGRLGNARLIDITNRSMAPHYAAYLIPGALWDTPPTRPVYLQSRFNKDGSVYVVITSNKPKWRCEFNLIPDEVLNFSRHRILRFFNLQVDQTVTTQQVTDFVVSAEVMVYGVKRVITFKGKSCVLLRLCKKGDSGGTTVPTKNPDKLIAVLQSLARQKRLVQTRKLNITSGTYASEFSKLKSIGLFESKGNLYYEAEQVSSQDINMRFTFDKQSEYIRLETDEAAETTVSVSSITKFDNLRIDASKSASNDRYYFLIDAVTRKGIITLKGETNIDLATEGKLVPVAGQGFECGELSKEALSLPNFISALAQLKHLLSLDAVPLIKFPEYKSSYYDTPLFPVGNNPKLTTWRLTERPSNFTSINAVLTNMTDQQVSSLCQFHLEVRSSVAGLDLRSLVKMIDIYPDPQPGQEGLTYHFKGTGVFIVNGVEMKETIYGYSCYPIARCETKKCGVLVYRFCYLPEADAQYNQTIPSLSVVQQNSQAMAEAMSKLIQPLWRPQSVFGVRVHTRDRLTADGALQTEYSNAYFMAFKTAGPLGHFHQYINLSNTSAVRPDYQALLTADREEEFKLANLKHYVDMEKSYPNADGRLTLAKPLFYRDPKLLLFFNKEYVYGMYADWDTYAGNQRWDSNLQASIIDPADNPDNPAVFYVDAEWERNDVPYVTTDESTLINFLENGVVCTTNIEITKFGLNTTFDVPELIPLKTYTALFNARFKKQSVSSFTNREVHRYVFATSRYANFEEQINSYITLTEYDKINPALITHQEKAFYDMTLNLNAADVARVQSVLSGSDPDALKTQFIHLYDRLMDGGFRLTAQEAPVTTEFNVVRNTVSGNVLGILIRNPEPFNDPKIPLTVLNAKKIVELSVNGGSSGLFKCVYSKDISSVFVTMNNNSLNMPTGNYTFTMRYLEYNPNTRDYDIASVVSAITLTVS